MSLIGKRVRDDDVTLLGNCVFLHKKFTSVSLLRYHSVTKQYNLLPANGR